MAEAMERCNGTKDDCKLSTGTFHEVNRLVQFIISLNSIRLDLVVFRKLPVPGIG